MKTVISCLLLLFSVNSWAQSILELEFVSDSSVYRYYDVPESIYQGLMDADSAGRFYNQTIRGQYPSRRLN